MVRKQRVFFVLIVSFFLLAASCEYLGSHAELAQNDLTLTINTNKQFYYPTELVRIFGWVKDPTNNTVAEANVGIQVVDPNNNTIFLDIIYSDSNGGYNDSFRLHSASLIGAYNIYASVYSAGYTIALANCTFSVVRPGDINGDGQVDIFDIVVVASAFGSVPGDAKWNAVADINNDNIVDIFDIAIVAVHFGETG